MISTTAHIEGSRSLRARMLVVGLVVALSVIALPGRATAHSTGVASSVAGLVNESRAAHGVHSLVPDGELQAVASRQARRMAQSGSIFHTRNLGDKLSWGWWAWAENVGYGPSIEWIHGAFMNSGYHAANIVDPTYNYIGVGVAYGSNGSVYVAQVFGAW